jgi:glycosyltransferase involved in cell wall biosynthesis
VIAANDEIPPIAPRGKFLSRRGEKFFFKALRLRPDSCSLDFNQKIAMRNRLADLRAAHTTALVIAEMKAEALLDVVAQAGLYALVEIDVPPEDLLSRSSLRATLSRIGERVGGLRSYPAIIGYLLNCPVDAELLRFHGLERLRRRLRSIVARIRSADDRKLVGMKHRPATVGLTLAEEDFVYATIPPLPAIELRRSVIRLHNLAEARPLVLEFTEGLPDQDEIIASAFGLGAAGVVAAPLPPACRLSNQLAHRSLSIKMLDSGELLPFLALNGACPPKPAQSPMVSVVICAYNAERTMRRCLESLRRLDYPDFEVIIVDDGSRDSTAQIAADFPEFRLIRQPNKGLSAARNVGLHASLGSLIAYTDSDCVVDPHWLTLMVRSILDGALDGCGGPNYAPHEDGLVEGCVAASPGAPCHVLIDDDRAEHLAGCNMLYRKAALLDIGGFDPQFTAAGDDVDVCWRLLDAGLALGYCPSAFVWHFRRNTIRAYYSQQRGYGKAEAMLYFKYPERFNVLGQIKWNGTIPGFARTVPGGGRIRVGWARSATQFQRVYEVPLSVAKVAPMTAEWNLATAGLLLLSLAFGVTVVPALAALAASPLWAVYYALKAPVEKCHKGLMSRLLISWLAYTGPITRTFARYRCRLSAQKPGLFDSPARQRPTIGWLHRSIRLTYWNDTYTARDAVLEHVKKIFASLRRPVMADQGWKDFDLLIEPDSWTRIELRTADEELGGPNIRTNVAARLRLSAGAHAGIVGCVLSAIGAALLGESLAAGAIGIIAAGAAICAVCQLVESGRLAYRVVEQSASELNLVPLGQPVTSTRPAPVSVAAESETSTEAQPAGR